MSSFYNRSNRNRNEYLVRGIKPVTLAGTTVTPISASRPASLRPVAASEFIRQKTAVGISSNVYDVMVEEQDPNIDLGVLYSNGTRLQYLDFKATTGVCDVVFKDTVVPVFDPVDGVTYDQLFPGYTITSAYSGSNAVVPMVPPNNVPTTGPPPASKVPVVPSKINC